MNKLILPDFTEDEREDIIHEILKQLQFSFGVDDDFLNQATFDKMKLYAIGLAVNQVAENRGLRHIHWRIEEDAR